MHEMCCRLAIARTDSTELQSPSSCALALCNYVATSDASTERTAIQPLLAITLQALHNNVITIPGLLASGYDVRSYGTKKGHGLATICYPLATLLYIVHIEPISLLSSQVPPSIPPSPSSSLAMHAMYSYMILHSWPHPDYRNLVLLFRCPGYDSLHAYSIIILNF